MKLWPLNPKTGARSSSLKTGFDPPSIAELESRTSASMDIEMLVGRAGLAAVAKAEAAAKAEEEAAKAAATTLEAIEGAPADGASPEEGGETNGSSTRSAEEGMIQHPSMPAVETVPSSVEAGDTVGASTSSCSSSTTTATTNAAPLDAEIAPVGAKTGTATTGKEATAAAEVAAAVPLQRKLALEVEVFAVGGINVLYLMALIKVSFEQVRPRS